MSKLDDIIARDKSALPILNELGPSSDRRYLLELVKDCQTALQLIADQTVCPALFPKDTDEDVICVKTAMTIAMVALEKIKA